MSSASRRWVKIWHEILNDVDFQNLSLEQQARFYHLLVFMSAQGVNGTIRVTAPARNLCALMQCQTFGALVDSLEGLPNVSVERNGNAEFVVTIARWAKYQVDTTSYERIQAYRERQFVTPQKKEKTPAKRKQKMSDEDFLAALKTNPAYKSIDIENELLKMDAWLLLPQHRQRKKTHAFILGWLNRCEKTFERSVKNGGKTGAVKAEAGKYDNTARTYAKD